MALPHWIRPRSKGAAARVSGLAVVAAGMVAGTLDHLAFSHAHVELKDKNIIRRLGAQQRVEAVQALP